jgi:hypothetical protein
MRRCKTKYMFYLRFEPFLEIIDGHIVVNKQWPSHDNNVQQAMTHETSRFRELQGARRGMSCIFMEMTYELTTFKSLVVSRRYIISPKPPKNKYITNASLGKEGREFKSNVLLSICTCACPVHHIHKSQGLSRPRI